MEYQKEGYYSQEDFNRDFRELEAKANTPKSSRSKSRKRRKKRKEKLLLQQSQANQRPPKKKRRRNKKKTALIILVCLALLGISGYLLAKNFVMQKLEKVQKEEVAKGDWGIDPRVAEELKDYKNIAILGVDTVEVNGESDEHSRSDGIIIMTINKKTNEVALTSVYRDSYLDLEEDGFHLIDKVTHAHSHGGPVNTVRALNRNLDLNIDDYVRVNWRSVADVSNSMGGLELNVTPENLNELNECIRDSGRALDEDYTLVDSPGVQLLTGNQIVAFCRMREVDGDTARSDRMREVINAAFKKAKKMKLSQLNRTADVALSEILTSMSSDTMMDMLLDLTAYEMDKSFGWPDQWQGAMIDGVSYVIPITLKSNVIDLHEKLFDQKDYEPTKNVLMINEQIKMRSGQYGEEDIDYALLDEYTNTFGYLAPGSDYTPEVTYPQEVIYPQDSLEEEPWEY